MGKRKSVALLRRCESDRLPTTTEEEEAAAEAEETVVLISKAEWRESQVLHVFFVMIIF